MSGLSQRNWAASAVIALALLSSRSASAQGPGVVYYPRGFGDAVVNGYAYEIVNKAKAERQLQYQLTKPAPDPRRVDNLRYRIAVDNWLIRKSMLCDPGYYPCRTDCISAAAIAEASRPAY